MVMVWQPRAASGARDDTIRYDTDAVGLRRLLVAWPRRVAVSIYTYVRHDTIRWAQCRRTDAQRPEGDSWEGYIRGSFVVDARCRLSRHTDGTRDGK